MKIISIIPARGGSKGLLHKNIKLLDGKPLLSYSIEQSLDSIVDKTVVTTDDKEIANIAREYGASVIMRPDYLATDTALTEPVIEHVLKIEKPDISVLLQPTSPIRGVNDIDNVIKLIGKYDSVFSVCKNTRFIWRRNNGKLMSLNYDYKDRKRRQVLPLEYIENGSIYAFKTRQFLVDNNRICGNYDIYVMSIEHSFEIDSHFDFWLCEQFMKRWKQSIIPILKGDDKKRDYKEEKDI